jgi:TRAP transporter 4TM/12TM fusion protein
MKRMGYRPSLAAAVEAAASTGGILMPPVMGAAAFLMADILAVSYWSIVVAALLPGCLYYVAMFTIVDFEGARDGIKGVPETEIPPLGPTLKRGWFLLVSIAVLLVALGYYDLPVDQSALLALAVLLILAACRKDGLRPPAILDGLESGGRLLGEIGSTGAIVGIIMGGFALTGLGALLPQAMGELAGDSLFLLLVLAAFASIVLGMGAPPLLVYVLLAATVAPTIIGMGVSPIAAHMFIFYFGLLSMLTPPVALSALIAARVAGASFWRTSIESCRLGIVAFIIPFFFVYQPVLLFEGDAGQLLHAIVTAVTGVVALSGALSRYFFIRRIALWEAAPLGLGGLLMLYPEGYSDMIGLALMAPTIVVTIIAMLRRRAAAQAS